MALETSLSHEEIEVVAADRPVQGLATEHLLGCTAADRLLRNGTLSDETLSSLLERYGDVRTRKLILAIGYFILLGLFLDRCRVPLETSDKIGTSVSPLG